MGKLDGKVAIVTGGAMGMGFGSARVMAGYGARVALIDLSDEVYKSAENLNAEGFTAIAFVADIRDAEMLNETYKKVANQFGKIDILVNAAGIGGGSKVFTDPTINETRDMVLDVNFKGTWNSCKAAIPYMIDANYGKIVNFASVTGCLVADPGMTSYGATKGAIMAFTKALAAEYAGSNITVNAIMPGVIDTPLMAKAFIKACPENPQSVKDAIAASIPMKRLGKIEEAGEVVSFLASDESSYVTGTSILFDGGSTLPESRGDGWSPAENRKKK